MTQHQPRDEAAHTTAGQRPGRPGGMPESDALAQALREVLTLTQLARGVLAERLEMPLTNVEAVEHVMLAKGAGEPIGPAELARRLGVTTAAGTQSVNRLVSEGHMSRAPHPHDGRRQVLDVTDSGFRHVMGELAPLLEVLFGASDGLSESERQGALAYLRNVARAYRTYLEAPRAG
ncbi:MarR family winged helix-turn-helix transcriptional regulator [Streptomyces sp. SPB4]|uniref:MarR family winged helix-turn-helix transcriptional regulator n=2 Tax=Streptomyces TaxID=1883 RepID=UPI002475C787|nr:MarR family winged helix-turn-helix transcriptional regulator [Streptomyces sp. SPB4]MDH6540110.1 DNA-binding MarR family transcriptional regulator [Streptomyces sp. SPB4]